MAAMLLAHMPDSLVELCTISAEAGNGDLSLGNGGPPNLSFHLSSPIIYYCLQLFRECGLAELRNILRNRPAHVKKPTNVICVLEAMC